MVPVAMGVLHLGSVVVALPLVVDHKLELIAILAGERQVSAIFTLMMMREVDVEVLVVGACGRGGRGRGRGPSTTKESRDALAAREMGRR